MNRPIFTCCKAKLHPPMVFLNLFSPCWTLISWGPNNTPVKKEDIDDVNWTISDPTNGYYKGKWAQWIVSQKISFLVNQWTFSFASVCIGNKQHPQ